MTRCFKISDTKICPHCSTKNLVRNGHTKNLKQQFYCKNCHKRCIDYYCNFACHPQTNNSIVRLTKEGLGIRSTAQMLGISTTTLLKRIIDIAKTITQPIISYRKTYEVDEMRTYIRKKQKPIWIVYALDRETKNVISFNIGRRTNKTLNVVLTSLRISKAKSIYTDGLKNYKYLIESNIHICKRFSTNLIERKNLSVRTHLKRLHRKTICFSKSRAILNAVLKIYFWSEFTNTPNNPPAKPRQYLSSIFLKQPSLHVR
uniref:IS1 family transposase n=1 Tax=Flavobacterium lotistagni TaxID=2709660 RepID=UPI001F4583DB|nr:IS1 family transposase [Flavobacterium lotistagni]